MDREELKNQLMLAMAQHGEVGDPEAQAQKIVAAIPEATRNMYPDDDVEAAVAFADIYYSSMSTAGAPSPEMVQTPAAAAEAMPSTFTSAQLKSINNVVKANQAAKAERTLKTTIERVLIDKPKPSDYLKADLKVVPTCRPDKLSQYEKQLVDDPENIAAFNQIKAAVESGTPMAVYINDSNPKTIGYEISTPSFDTGSEQMTKLVMSTKKLLGFVATELSGYIASPETGTGLGCKLQWHQPRGAKGAKASVSQSEGSPRLRVTGRSEALKDASKHDVTSVVDKSAKKRKGKLRIALSFRVDTGKRNSKGEAIVRTVRLSGDADLPTFQRKTPEYKAAFPLTDSRAGIAPPTQAEARKLQEDQTKVAAFILAQGGGAVYDYGMETVAESITNELAKSGDTSGVEF